MDKTKVAVIGLGTVAQLVHLPNLVKIKNAQVVSVAEIKKNRLNTIADKFKLKETYKDYKELLDKSDVEAVIIATPTSLHKDIAVDCLNAGKHVLVEKPLARDYNEGKAIVDAAIKNNRKLMVGMNLRYRPDSMLIKTLINSGEIGKPFYVKSGWIRRQSSSGNWFTKREEAGGGVILDLGINLLDLTLWLLDYPRVKSVSTMNYFQNTKKLEDTSISYLRCEDNSLINIETSWSLPQGKDVFEIIIYGTNGSIAVNPFRLFKRIEDEHIDLSSKIIDSPTESFKKSYLNELKSFIGAIRGLNPVFSSGEEALKLMNIVKAMYSSASKNYEIKLSKS
jgi:predicted dehydrogenase